MYTAVISIDKNWLNMLEVNDALRSCSQHSASSKVHMFKPCFIACSVYGVCGFLFNDFGDNFLVEDADGEIAKEVYLYNLSIYRISLKIF